MGCRCSRCFWQYSLMSFCSQAKIRHLVQVVFVSNLYFWSVWNDVNIWSRYKRWKKWFSLIRPHLSRDFCYHFSGWVCCKLQLHWIQPRIFLTATKGCGQIISELSSPLHPTGASSDERPPQTKQRWNKRWNFCMATVSQPPSSCWCCSKISSKLWGDGWGGPYEQEQEEVN